MPLKVDLAIPYANGCNFAITERDRSLAVSFSPDPHGGPECLWFCFRLRKISPESHSHVTLVLMHSSNMLGANSPQKMRPVIKYTQRDWTRLDAPEIITLPDGQTTVSWQIPMPEDYVDIAYCYPYGMPEINQLIRDTNGYWQKDPIGMSQKARPIIRLSNSYGSENHNPKRRGLYLVARQHSGETSGSWVLDGFLRYIARMGDKAPLIWVVPLANTDGVEDGDYGKDNFPYDLNRAWGTPPMRHEILVLQRDMMRWRKRCRPMLGLDFHSPGACENEGIYCFLPKYRHFLAYRRVSTFVRCIKKELGAKFAASKFGRIARYTSRWNTPGFSTFCWEKGHFPALSFETPYALIKDQVLTREHYQEAGALIAAAIVKKLKLL